MWYGKHIEGSPYIVSILILLVTFWPKDCPTYNNLLSNQFKVEGDGPTPTVEELVKKIKVYGKGLDYPKSQEYNEILIDCRKIYLKDHKLRCTVKSPPRSSAMVKLQDNLDGTYSLYYKPTFAGSYLINIRVDDIHVEGSPFTGVVRS